MHESFVSNLSQRIRKRYGFNFGIGERPFPYLPDTIRDYDMSRSFRRTFKQFLFVLCVYDAIFAGVIFIISYFYLLNAFSSECPKDVYVPKPRAVCNQNLLRRIHDGKQNLNVLHFNIFQGAKLIHRTVGINPFYLRRNRNPFCGRVDTL